MSDIRDMVAHTLSTLEAFAALLGLETAALRRMDLAGAKAIGDRKAILAHTCQKEVTQLRKQHEEIKIWLEADDQAKARFIAAWQHLAQALSENVYYLQRTENAVRQVVAVIVDVTRKAQRSFVSYGPVVTAGVYGRVPQPVTVNRML
jgi:hypothetical protein